MDNRTEQNIAKIKSLGLVHATSRDFKSILNLMKNNTIQLSANDFTSFVQIVLNTQKEERMCQLLEAATYCDIPTSNAEELHYVLTSYQQGLNFIKHDYTKRDFLLRCLHFIIGKYEKLNTHTAYKNERLAELQSYGEWVIALNDSDLCHKIERCKSTIDHPERPSALDSFWSNLIRPKQTKSKHEQTQAEQYEDIQNKLNILLKGEEIISKQVQALDINMDKKLDMILDKVSGLSKSIIDIKDSKESNPRTKWNNIVKEVDRQSELFSFDKKLYADKVKVWFGKQNFQSLEGPSHQYLINAEFLYEQLQKLETGDMSPFVAQYCRALELELKSKLFTPFAKEVKKNPNFREKYAVDFRGPVNGKSAKKLADSIALPKFRIELGTMAYTMKLIENEVHSPLLDDLKAYVERNFKSDLITTHYFQKIADITSNYRNAAAHTDLIDVEKANAAKKDVRDALKFFFDMQK